MKYFFSCIFKNYLRFVFKTILDLFCDILVFLLSLLFAVNNIYIRRYNIINFCTVIYFKSVAISQRLAKLKVCIAWRKNEAVIGYTFKKITNFNIGVYYNVKLKLNRTWNNFQKESALLQCFGSKIKGLTNLIKI